MSLDLFNPLPALQNAQSNLAPELPAEFSEAFDVSTRAMTEWNSSLNYQNARERALATFYDDIKAQTGVQLPLYGMGGAVSLEELNDGIAKLPRPLEGAGQSWRPLSESDIDAMALSRMRKAHEDAAAFGRRETTWGGTLGSITGTLAAGVSDPVAMATLPLGGAGQAGIAFRALEFALIGAGTEAAIAGSGASSRAAAVPGSLREIPGEIASAGLFGGIFGAGIGGLQKLAGTGARTLPVTVRDEVHAATSEAQLNLTNPFPTAAGEAAHRDAVISAVRSAIDGRPVAAGEEFFQAYHGSPYAFDRFDTDRINTGEGMQAYGHGLYFAENRKVAQDYATELGAKRGVYDMDPNSPTLGEFQGVSPGHVYDVEIRGNQQNFLDLEKPIAEQGDRVREAMATFGVDEALTGEQAYRRIGVSVGPREMNDTVGREAAASKALSEAGIPGLRYLDAGSRGGKKGTRNFVVFNDKDVRITSRDGKQLTIAEARAADYALAAKSQTPEELAIAGEKHLRPETYGLAPDVERFDRMPSEADDVASYWDKRLEGASAEERAALGATDDVGETVAAAAIRSEQGQVFTGTTHADAGVALFDAGHSLSAKEAGDGFVTSTGRFIDRDEAKAIASAKDQLKNPDFIGPDTVLHARDVRLKSAEPVVAARDLSPTEMTALEADPKTLDAATHDLDHVLAANPDAEFTTQARLPDGTYQFTTQKLSDVIKELDEFERAAKELEACVIGLEAAE